MEGPSTHRRELYFRKRQEYQGCRNMKRGENLKSWDRDHKLHFWSLSSGSRGLITGARSSSFFLSLRFMKYPGILPNFFFFFRYLEWFWSLWTNGLQPSPLATLWEHRHWGMHELLPLNCNWDEWLDWRECALQTASICLSMELTWNKRY